MKDEEWEAFRAQAANYGLYYAINEDGTVRPTDNIVEAFNPETKRIALTEITSPNGVNYQISTVFLGLNHQFGDGPPIVFETMIFGGRTDHYCERYSTIKEARDGHAYAVHLVEQDILKEEEDSEED